MHVALFKLTLLVIPSLACMSGRCTNWTGGEEMKFEARKLTLLELKVVITFMGTFAPS